MSRSTKQEKLKRLNQIGIALSSERDLDSLLNRIVLEAMDFTHAQGGTLFIVKGGRLQFRTTRNHVLEQRNQDVSLAEELSESSLEISRDSIAGYVADTGEIVAIDDVTDLSESAPYQFNAAFDRKYDYRTRSLLGIPLTLENDEIIGVLLLVNACDPDGNVTSFSGRNMDLVRSLASQAGIALQNTRLSERIENASLETVHRLSLTAELKSKETSEHIQRMSRYTRRIAEEYGCDDQFVEDLRYAVPMHDVGKVGIPDRILEKSDDLTDEEYERMKQHTVMGYLILRDSDSEVIQLASRVALTHHEQWDGSGYPAGLQGENIPLSARITAVADVFDALTSSRSYKEAFSVERSRSMIEEDAGTHFDPEVVDAFLSCLDELVGIRNQYGARLHAEQNITNPNEYQVESLLKDAGITPRT